MSKLTVKLAERSAEVEQALRLRYQVFAEEANIARMKNPEGIERDEFDDYCDHLIVRDEEKDLVVGVYRLLPGRRVRNGRIYTSTEFNLKGFAGQIPHALEIGRSCVHPDYRDCLTMLMLWNGMLGYFADNSFHYLMGCASLRTDDLRAINTIHSYFRNQRYDIGRYGIRPLPGLHVDQLQYLGYVDDSSVFPLLPALIKGYLRLGSEAVAEPVFDPVFQSYDFCMILNKRQVSPKYRRRFLAPAALVER